MKILGRQIMQGLDKLEPNICFAHLTNCMFFFILSSTIDITTSYAICGCLMASKNLKYKKKWNNIIKQLTERENIYSIV